MYKKLKEERLKKGFTSRLMAEKVGISVPFYSQLENERRKISYEMAVKIAKALETKPDNLFYDEVKERI